MPDADQEDSFVVSITAEGSMYFGVNPITPAEVSEKINHGVSTIYIKADGNTMYGNVMKALGAARAAGVRAASLLPLEPGTAVPPKGLEVLVGLPQSSRAGSTVVEVLDSGQRWPALKINNVDIPWAALAGTVKQLIRKRSDKVISVKAQRTLPFADVVVVTDVCRSVRAKVALD